MAKIGCFDSFGAVFPHVCPINVKFGMGEQTLRAKFHVYRSNVSPLWGKKNIFGPLSKNNTGMAALHVFDRRTFPVLR